MACEWISIFRASLNENRRFVLSNFIIYEIWKCIFKIKGTVSHSSPLPNEYRNIVNFFFTNICIKIVIETKPFKMKLFAFNVEINEIIFP